MKTTLLLLIAIFLLTAILCDATPTSNPTEMAVAAVQSNDEEKIEKKKKLFSHVETLKKKISNYFDSPSKEIAKEREIFEEVAKGLKKMYKQKKQLQDAIDELRKAFVGKKGRKGKKHRKGKKGKKSKRRRRRRRGWSKLLKFKRYDTHMGFDSHHWTHNTKWRSGGSRKYRAFNRRRIRRLKLYFPSSGRRVVLRLPHKTTLLNIFRHNKEYQLHVEKGSSTPGGAMGISVTPISPYWRINSRSRGYSNGVRIGGWFRYSYGYWQHDYNGWNTSPAEFAGIGLYQLHWGGFHRYSCGYRDYRYRFGNSLAVIVYGK